MMPTTSRFTLTLTRRTLLVLALGLPALGTLSACGEGEIADPLGDAQELLSSARRTSRERDIKAAAAARGLTNGLLLAGIAQAETGLAHCWSEATWACQGPASADCGGGPVIAGAGDGPCSLHQGGLGMFQFDAGTFTQTIAREGRRVLSVKGNTDAAVDYVLSMVKRSQFISGVSTNAQALAWMNGVRVGNAKYATWIKTVTAYYNGCFPGSCSVYSSRYAHYDESTRHVLNERGNAFWYPSTPPPSHPAAECKHRTGPFAWNCRGAISGMSCTKISEGADPDTWNDNYFCAAHSIGARWSSSGPISGMRCTQVKEGSDPHTWNDNYLCVPPESPYHFSWSNHGKIDGQNCLQWQEPADHDTWNDNFLCWSKKCRQDHGPFSWSCAGPIDGMACTQIKEGADPDTWNDNYFCAQQDLGLRWSYHGTVDGMRCTQIAEGADPHTWRDNYLCLPENASYHFSWSSSGPVRGKSCIAWFEPADPDTWDDNYLCW
jgi:hypothetical protein